MPELSGHKRRAIKVRSCDLTAWTLLMDKLTFQVLCDENRLIFKKYTRLILFFLFSFYIHKREENLKNDNVV